MRALILALLLCGCAATGADGARQGVVIANGTIGLGYRGVRLYARGEKEVVQALHRDGKVDQASAEIAKLEKTSGVLFKVLDTTADASNATDEAITVAEKAKQKDYAAIMTPLQRAIFDLLAAFASAGVKLPFGGK